MIWAPVAIEPVRETMRTLLWPVSGSPTVGPRPKSTLMTPAGKISFASSASFNAVSGVISEGLMTTQLPAASAGAASRPPSSTDSSTVQSRPLRRLDRGGSSKYAPPDTLLPPFPADTRGAGEEAKHIGNRRHFVIDNTMQRLTAV